jgi:hypothetical protein
MSGKFEIAVEPAEPGKAVAHVILPNGYEWKSERMDPGDAYHVAEGIRQGFVLALNAIGFVPAVKHKGVAF